MVSNDAEILEFRGEDVPFIVEQFCKRGFKAFGITGNDLMQEYLSKNQSRLQVIKTIPWQDESFLFKKPTLCLLAKKEKNFVGVDSSIVVAVNAKYERLSKNFLEKLERNGTKIQTITVNGSTELAVEQGLAGACVEIVCTGASLEEFGLKIIERFFESDLVIVGYREQEENALERLSNTVNERILENSEGSYTASIVRNGQVLKKLNEECFELTQAALQERKSKIVWETADLLYFLAVLLAEKGVQFQEVWNELRRRELEKQK